MTDSLAAIGELRGKRNVILYASAFLQKPNVPGASIMITNEDLNGLMSVIYGMDCTKGLTLILHTPGGVTNAAESIVSYIREKFTDVEVIIPAFAMSAGTMISLSAERVVMGRQSQLGPIDPQMGVGAGGSVSARAVTEQFDRAKAEVMADVAAAHVWAPIVQSLGPALLQEAQNALDYSERMVARWLTKGMFRDEVDAVSKGNRIAHHFNDASTHKSHGRRIDRQEAREQGVVVEDLEDSQALQEQVLTAYHLMTITFDQTSSVKLLWSDAGSTWQKSWIGQETQS
ncbi:S49 family peptidase [Rhodococcus fascians]|nr:S49 family peptidase [Rhodococcus fascians]MBY3998800.1 S49 family peptidase [Rhodococcus fascians]MBY4003604.1 S49 family peptidase [Rhodococcus fascians]MBY4008354.1 S49 family peptidase [Rhodococcus fascians]MBY4018487.1 S49 family peptidase [Rhodococcus fascians]